MYKIGDRFLLSWWTDHVYTFDRYGDWICVRCNSPSGSDKRT